MTTPFRPSRPSRPFRPQNWNCLRNATGLGAPLALALTLTLSLSALPAMADEAKAKADAEVADDVDADVKPRQQPARPTARSSRPVLRTGIDQVLLELGATPEHPSASSAAWVRATPYLQWQPTRNWEFRASVDLDAVRQSGNQAYNDANASLGETWIRWRQGDTRLSAGLQTILWGRVDGMPLIDRVSRVDISRVLLDDLPDRRLPQAALRWEQAFGEWSLDAVLLPSFQGADLPEAGSIWNPLNRRTGRVLGISPQPAPSPLTALVRNGTVNQEDGGDGGAALRITRTGEPVDFGFVVGRTRQSLPYFRPDFARGTLTAVYPFSRFLGADAEWVAAGATWRTELVASRGVPLTTPLGQTVAANAVEWIGAVEFFPGGGDTRVNLQVLTRQISVNTEVLELTRYSGVNGEVESTFGQGRWKLGLQFASGLSVHDLYLSPRVSYLGFEPHEIMFSMHGFRGNERTLGGFYRDNAYVALSVRTRF